MTGNNLEKGLKGEEIACKYLIDNGYRILERNYRLKTGEIDIIAFKENILIFVEVKARSSNYYGYPYEAVNRKKQEKIISTAMHYVKLHNIRNTQFRFDVVEVYLSNGNKVNHYINAFM